MTAAKGIVETGGLGGRVLGDPRARLGLSILGLFALLVLFGPFVVPYDPSEFVGASHEPPSARHWLGTTGQGQDVLAQAVVGARLSLGVGFGVGLGVTLLGAVIGLAGAYFRGIADEALSLVTNVFLLMPGLPLAVVVAAYLPRGPLTIAGVLVLTGWAWAARVFRAQALSIRDRDFVAAAVASGESSTRVLFAEILPNMTSVLAASFIGATVYAIGAQVGLEFLGLGDPTAISWGTNLYWANNHSALLLGAWWTILPTGLSIALVGFALVEINYALDEITNPRLKPERAWQRLLAAHGLRPGRLTPVVRLGGAAPSSPVERAQGA